MKVVSPLGKNLPRQLFKHLLADRFVKSLEGLFDITRVGFLSNRRNSLDRLTLETFENGLHIDRLLIL